MSRPRASQPEGGWPNSFLSRLEPSVRQRLLEAGVRREYLPGEVLLRQGEDSDHVILILSGLAKVTVGTEGGHTALLDIRASGDIVGELGAIDGEPRSATLTACGRLVGWRIDRDRFRALLRSHPDAALLMTAMVGERLRMANRRRVEFGGYSVEVRLARVLVELGRSLGRETRRGVRIAVELTQPELAELVGAATVSVQKALRELRSAGLVATGYRHVIILDIEGLAKFEPRTPTRSSRRPPSHGHAN